MTISSLLYIKFSRGASEYNLFHRPFAITSSERWLVP